MPKGGRTRKRKAWRRYDRNLSGNRYDGVEARCAPRGIPSSRQPQYSIGLELDITHFLEAVRKSGFFFTLAITYAAAECANAVEEFRYRFLDGRIVLFDRIHMFARGYRSLQGRPGGYAGFYGGLCRACGGDGEKSRRPILPARPSRMCFSSPPFRGFPLPTFPIPIPDDRTMPSH